VQHHYVCFKDDESCEDKEGSACNLHVTHRKCVQNSGQNFSRKGLFKKPRYGSEDNIKIDLKERKRLEVCGLDSFNSRYGQVVMKLSVHN
jgi:hypothetical protein